VFWKDLVQISIGTPTFLTDTSIMNGTVLVGLIVEL